MAKMFGKAWVMELLHYVVLVLVLAQIMAPDQLINILNDWRSQLVVGTALIALIIVDQLLRKFLLKEPFSMW